jgi:hypothetical protein
MERADKALIALLSGLVLLYAPALSAQQRYNPHTGGWETAPPDAQLRYNPHSGNWGYAAPDASPQYNPHTRKWDMAPPNAQYNYNPRSGIWEPYGKSDATGSAPR